jgi:hypothetical protein
MLLFKSAIELHLVVSDFANLNKKEYLKKLVKRNVESVGDRESGDFIFLKAAHLKKKLL